MPETPNPKLREPPPPILGAVAPSEFAYAELDVRTNFSFLRGASHPDELIYRAAQLGYQAIAVTDINSLAGVVRAHDAAKEVGLKLLIGSRLAFLDAPELLVWASDRPAYARLCRLLTTGKKRTEKANCALHLSDLLNDNSGLLAAVADPGIDAGESQARSQESSLIDLRDALGDRLSLAAGCMYGPDDFTRLRRIAELSSRLEIPLLATNDVHYHDSTRRALQDLLTCVREGCTISTAGRKLFANGERYLKSPEQMHRLFADYPQAIRRGLQIAEQCSFRLDSLRYEYPDEVVPEGRQPIEYLAELTWSGAAERYPGGIPDKVRELLLRELALIEQLQFEPYFLTVYDLIRFARSRGILCQGRGSAANSAVCYCIGVTSVDPARIDLLFERFISAARNEPPDIDIDFEHERREEVIQYVYEKYGRERSGMTGEVITYRGRSAVRDVGKAMGLSLDMVDTMASRLDWWHKGVLTPEQIRECGLDPADRTVRLVIELATELLGFPRHLSQHVGGMVMTRGPLCEMVPIENAAMPDRTVIEWDKNDIDSIGILKVDILALGMLTCISKALKFVNAEGAKAGQAGTVEMHTIPPEDPAVYDMICDADTIGVFQIESRAQMTMLPRLRPRCFYDLVIEVAIVRPGPIQGDMVHPYLRRRNGQEPVSFPSEAMREVLWKTLGVPLFQEQAMRVAMVGAGFSGAEADKLRRVMAAWRRSGAIEHFHQKIVQGMIGNGYAPEFAEQCFNQIKGFGEYGFPESHSASFALLVYVSAWLKRHHPAAFAGALINSQPMGFYMPAQIVRDAKEHGVEIRAVDVNESDWDCTLEEPVLKERGTGVSPVLKSQCTHGAGPDNTVASRDRQGAMEPRNSESPDHFASSLPHGRGSLRTLSDQSMSEIPSKSAWGFAGPALRLGFRQVKGFREAHARQIMAARQKSGRFDAIRSLQIRAGLPVSALRILAEADAFASLGLSRRQALWEVMQMTDESAPLFETASTIEPTRPAETEDSDGSSLLPTMPVGQEVMTDYATAGLSLKRHPLALVRQTLRQQRIITSSELSLTPNGRWVKVAGLVLIRQRPATASGIVFETLEDETGVINLIVKPDIFDRFRPAARHAILLQCDGYVQREGQVIHVMAKRLFDLSDMIQGYDVKSRDFH